MVSIEQAQGAPKRRKWPADAAALLAFAGLAAVFLWPLLRNMSWTIMSYDTSGPVDACDSFEFVWRYWWATAAARFGLDPLHCTWVYPPTGDSLLFHSHPWASELLTLPLGLAFGPVVGYNLMILLMLVFGAWGYYLVLRRGLNIGGAPAWVVGAAFGFSGYMLLRAHWHVNMLGACFWGPALGILVSAYYQNKFTFWRGCFFAVFFWATFWNSFIEVFMLAIVSGLTVVLYEIRRLITSRFSLWRSIVFCLPVVVGCASLLVLRGGPSFDQLRMPLVDTAGFVDFFRFPHLSLFAPLTTPSRPPNWGIAFPYAVLIAAVVGLISGMRRRPGDAAMMAILFAAVLVLAADPYHVVSNAVRRLPLGEGFRLFTRFSPFALFFLGILAAWGGDWMWNVWAKKGGRSVVRDRRRLGVAAALAVFLLIELYPAQLTLRPVQTLDVPRDVKTLLRSGGYCLVVPEGPAFVQVDDTYQVALDAPCVLLTFWDKMDKTAKADRESKYPLVYPPANTYPLRPKVESPEILDELDALDVRYVLFADKRQLQDSVIRGDVLLESDREILIRRR